MMGIEQPQKAGFTFLASFAVRAIWGNMKWGIMTQLEKVLWSSTN